MDTGAWQSTGWEPLWDWLFGVLLNFHMTSQLSFPRRRESSVSRKRRWVPAFAGTTTLVFVEHARYLSAPNEFPPSRE